MSNNSSQKFKDNLSDQSGPSYIVLNPRSLVCEFTPPTSFNDSASYAHNPIILHHRALDLLDSDDRISAIGPVDGAHFSRLENVTLRERVAV